MQKSWKNGSQYLYTYHLDSAIYICYTYHIVNLSIHVHFFFKKNLFFCCTGSSWLLHGLSLVAVSGGYSLVAVCKRRLVEAFLAVCRAWPLEQGLRSRGGCTWLLRRIGDLPRPGTEPVSPALAGRFFTTEPQRNL